MDALDKAGHIAGAAEHKAAGWCTHFAFQPLPAAKEAVALEALETGKKLVSYLEPGSRHIYEAGFWEIVQGPERRGRKEDGSLAAVIGAGGCNWLTGFVAQQDSGLPVVQVGEPDALGELQDGDELGHESSE
jgi:hypothetical protein